MPKSSLQVPAPNRRVLANGLPVKSHSVLLAVQPMQRARAQNAVFGKLRCARQAVRKIIILGAKAEVASFAANRRKLIVRERFRRKGAQQIQHGGPCLMAFCLVHDDG